MNRTIEARILRVNHGGERGAILIYRAQILLARLWCPDLVPFLKTTLKDEIEHRDAFLTLMPSRASKPCRLMWIWSGGGLALGVMTGMLGRNGILACTEAVERTVHEHMSQQAAYLDGRDPEMSALIRRIQQQELDHLNDATALRSGRGWVWLDHLIKFATNSLIWVSTRGDSARLAQAIST